MKDVRAAINPYSSAFTRWWCRSDLRAALNGKPRGAYKRFMPRRPVLAHPVDEAVMRSRRAELDRLMGQDDPRGDQP